MAAFLYRFAGRPEYTPPAVSPFPDVSTDSSFYEAICWLAESDITRGYPDGTFRSRRVVSRGQMAAFLYRYAGSPAFSAPSLSPFPDVPTGDKFYRAVSWLADVRVTHGTADGSFEPTSTVSRGQMAAFLFRFDRDVMPHA